MLAKQYPLYVQCHPLQQWFSAFLKLQPLNTVPHVVVTLNHKIISLPLLNCNSAIVMNCNVNICFLMVLGDPCESAN